jgi:hypothetical protein
VGGWTGVPDLSAAAQLVAGKPNYEMRHWVPVPGGAFIPVCGMNLAFTWEALPMMYFLLMGRDREGNRWPFDRFGDIWMGVIAKRICDHLGEAMSSGRPTVHHARASNVWSNLEKESPGLPVNEDMWRTIYDLTLAQSTILDCYLEVSANLRRGMCGLRPEYQDYWIALEQAMRIWTEEANR